MWSCHLSIPLLIIDIITFHGSHIIISPSQRYCISYESTDTWYTIRWYQYRYIDSCWELWVYIPIPMNLEPYPLLWVLEHLPGIGNICMSFVILLLLLSFIHHKILSPYSFEHNFLLQPKSLLMFNLKFAEILLMQLISLLTVLWWSYIYM